MDNAVAAFAKSVSIATCRVINTPNIILLCGGSTSKDHQPTGSARDYFYRYLSTQHRALAKRVKLAEAINDWFDQDTFADLLELEEYLADFSDQIILFVESPGSIAELGAFATSKSLSPKTLAVINTAYKQVRTFIADGPIRRLKAVDQRLVWSYPWNPEKPNDPETQETFANLSVDLADLLSRRERDAPKERQLTRSHAHAMLIAADLVDIMGIVTGDDILGCLAQWDFSVNRAHLKKYVTLLEHLEILYPWPYSSQKYYVSRAESTFIRYGFNPDAPSRDRERIRSIARAAISVRGDSRAKAFRSYLRRLSRGSKYV